MNARVGWVAGEKSGDLIAGPVVSRLAVAGYAEQAGIGGPAMTAAGLQAWWSIDALSVRGYTEVLTALPRLLKLRRDLRRRMLAWQPRVMIGVDAPDFNLTLETDLRARGIRTVHFVSPSIWAWRADRLPRIARAADHLLLVFPFEQALYADAGVPATYVGHPLADAIDPAAWSLAASRKALGLLPDAPTVCLMPGSRGSEIGYLAEPFLQAAQWLHQRLPTVQFVLPATTAALRARIEAIHARLDPDRLLKLTLVDGQSHQAMSAADTLLVASGTATLEAALFLKPMVIGYRVAVTSYEVMLRMSLQPWIGLPNILCRDMVVPELVQHQATPVNLGRALLDQLEQPQRVARIVERFADLRGQLAIGCADRAAAVIDRLANHD